MRNNQEIKVKRLTFPQDQKRISFIVTAQGAFQKVIQNKQNNSNQNPTTILNMFGKLQSKKITIGKFNSFRLTKQNQLQDMLTPLSYNQTNNLQDIQFMQKKCSCKCKMSKCLKLYCQCFSKQLFCGSDCSCTGCDNNQANQRKLLMLRQQTGNKKPMEQKGCKCVKSNCRKKYCDCYQRGLQCGQHCQCKNCQNLGNESNYPKKQLNDQEQGQQDEEEAQIQVQEIQAQIVNKKKNKSKNKKNQESLK